MSGNDKSGESYRKWKRFEAACKKRSLFLRKESYEAKAFELVSD